MRPKTYSKNKIAIFISKLYKILSVFYLFILG